jgi:hypothetical protein
MTRRLIHHIRRNIIGYTAIFLALGGTSYAAWLAPADSVNSAAIIDGQVTTPDLAQNVIRADENCALYYGCWGSKEIANGAVASSEIAGGAVGNTQLADASVNSQKIVLGSILGNRIAPQAIGNSQLAPDAVTGDKVKDGSITAADIAGGIPPDSPVGWGSVGQNACDNACSLDVKRNVIGVWSPQLGIYCVWVAGAPPSSHTIVVSPYHDDPFELVVAQGDDRHLCDESTQFEVETMTNDPYSPTTNTGGTHWHAGGFSFIVT